MTWSEALVAEIAERRGVFLLGAGASAGSVSSTGQSPPSWKSLLERLKSRSRLDAEALGQVEDLVRKEQYLDAAEIILHGLPPADLRTVMREELLLPRYEASVIHQLILEIDPKIVITTNYDTIYDEHCSGGEAEAGYSVKKHTSQDLLNEVRSTARLVIKAHGCVTDIPDIVLSRSQYYQARARYPAFFAVVNSLFLTNTVVFVGYSLKDPDIALVLENASIAAPCAHPHWALVAKGTPSPLKAALSRAYNIEFLEYDNASGDHAAAVVALEELRDRVLAYRARYQMR